VTTHLIAHPCTWVATNMTGVFITIIWWYARVNLYLDHSEWPRPILLMEVAPVLMISLSVFAAVIPATWLIITSPRRLELSFAATALLVTAPAIVTPLIMTSILRMLPLNLLPGARYLDPSSPTPVADLFGWADMAAFVPTLMICAGIALLTEGILGRLVSLPIAPLTLLLIVIFQTRGYCRFLPGVPHTATTSNTTGWLVGIVTWVIGIAIFGTTRGGSRGLLSRY